MKPRLIDRILTILLGFDLLLGLWWLVANFSMKS
jgi:hypothetical protein